MPGATTPWVRAFVGLGANLGDPQACLNQALQDLREQPGLHLVAQSSFYGSAPVDAEGPDYLNAVAAFDTSQSPLGLLALLQALEQKAGRQRPWPNAPRTLDLDLLLHGDTVMQTEQLALPHPRMHLRAFVLLPLLEIAPGLVLPLHGPVQALLNGVSGQRIRRLD